MRHLLIHLLYWLLDRLGDERVPVPESYEEWLDTHIKKALALAFPETNGWWIDELTEELREER